ncbi:MAG TPA: class I SAM-dependent methyltransferase [Pyrinomonadaceae bacterium]|jgi:SAM-dependent methyltransferase
MSASYEAEIIRGYFDALAEQEWARLEATLEGRVSLHLHGSYLREFIHAGAEVLEIGAGPGRFTIELARLGARVTVGDVSEVQLDLNRERVAAAGCEASVVARKVLDIVDLSDLPSERFDAVVAYGGPLSYAMEHADEALGHLLRVTRRGGHVLLSVMALVGATRKFAASCVKWARERSLGEVERVIRTGDQAGDIARGHHCHMYRWAELAALVARHRCVVVAASASNFLSVNQDEALGTLPDEPELWATFLRWEREYCREPGALDGGTHIIAVLQRV